MKYECQQFVRWDDVDAFGHVNNAKYLVYAQEARFQWSTVQFDGKDEPPSIIAMVVGRAEVDFIAPIYVGGHFVDVILWVDSISNSSFVMTCEIFDKGVLVARVKSVQVAVSLETKKSRPLTDNERTFLTKYLEK